MERGPDELLRRIEALRADRTSGASALVQEAIAILASERAARPFGLRIPGGALPVANDRNHRRAALTLLAMYPKERA